MTFSGNLTIASATLTSVVRPWLHRDLTLDEMRAMADAVTAYYRAHGFLVAQAHLGKQAIAGDTVKLNVIEGRYSDVVVASNHSRVSSERIRRTVMANACGHSDSCTGVGPILRDDVERAGLLVSEIPGVAASYVLKPGQQPGSTSIVLDARPTRRFAGSAAVDNEGFAFTGRDRLSVGLAAANLAGIGDLVTLNGVYAGSGLFSFAGDASAPVGYHGARAGLDGSHLHYALGREFAPLGATGLSDTAGVYVNYPLRRTLDGSLDLRLDLLGKSITGDIAAAFSRSREAALEAMVSLSGARTDTLFKSASSQFRLVYTAGDLFLQDDASKAFDAATARTAGDFGKLTYQLRREELILPRWTLYASLSGQMASKNLDSSEKFEVTGPAAVRAYPAGEVSSDIATLLTLETRIGLPPSLLHGYQLTIAPFYDRAWATFNRTAWTGFAGPPSAIFSGGGAYLSLVSPGRYSLRATWAVRDGAPPSAANDARSQVWLEAAAAF